MNKSISIARGFVLLNAIIWLAFSIIVATGMHPALPDSVFYKWFLAISAFVSAAFLLLLYFLLKNQSKIAFFLTITFLILIALLTMMDDLGWIDFLVLVVTLIPVVILIKEREWFLKTSRTSQR
ncbi:MAG: hypothetical protein CVU40_09340 [Chloroflexi bacterium HGW-Chloroflexi-2]|jgi:lysylphosphatidylglycerol synthetase-like protein (DUF2156 family)|nr:MAG: hypothetical protein CVU40_09340 [Chloroflexi bacterium HGW-Chloroflexi-2]